jgi:diaminohydroxyphosphoribosylaminopyrimidine deaminase/5-amino-6-(5-phosphoribosylamino)uracil reductase
VNEPTSEQLRTWMREALDLAVRGRGQVEPNPRVGAVAIQDGVVVGRGFHERWGGPHAEVHALRDAEANGAEPDTVVVTLEPCCTPLGVSGKKTPPCTGALIDAGVRHVVIGMSDPDPRHRGRGVTELEEHGIKVWDGVLVDECKAINRPFLRWLGLDRPWTLAKWAMTLDGKTAAPTGESRWISGFESRRAVHEIRARVDAVVVGYRTARLDDPVLTVRHVDGDDPIRIVVDPWAELPVESRLVETAKDTPTWVLVHVDADEVRVERLRSLGVEVLPTPPAGTGRRLHLIEAWRTLRQRGVRTLMVEGGGGLVAQLLGWNCIDQVLCFLAPKVIGGKLAPTRFRATDGRSWRKPGASRRCTGPRPTKIWRSARSCWTSPSVGRAARLWLQVSRTPIGSDR